MLPTFLNQDEIQPTTKRAKTRFFYLNPFCQFQLSRMESSREYCACQPRTLLILVVSLTGLLSTAGNHVHLSVSDSTGRTIGRHLLDGNLVYTTLEVVIGEGLDHSKARETDPTFGYKELVIRKIDK
jgi:hypothetical protein